MNKRIRKKKIFNDRRDYKGVATKSIEEDADKLKELALQLYQHIYFVKNEKTNMTIPKITRTAPVARFSVFAGALLANKAAVLAQIKVNNTHKKNTGQFGRPPIIK